MVHNVNRCFKLCYLLLFFFGFLASESIFDMMSNRKNRNPKSAKKVAAKWPKLVVLNTELFLLDVGQKKKKQEDFNSMAIRQK